MNQLEQLSAFLGPAKALEMKATMDAFAETMAKVLAAMERLTLDRRFRRMLGLPRRDEHHPERLPIDGAAYARRRAARRRRR